MANEATRKILRVGIIQGGRIVEERLIRKQQDVTIGTASKNTFIVPVTKLPKSFALFQAKGEGYVLAYDDSMEGRVSLADEVVDLKALAKSGKVQRRGGRYVVDLDLKSRGKVVIGDFTLLFQFVDAPPVLPKAQLPAAARGGLGSRLDWLLMNVLLLSFLAQGAPAIGLDIWWRQSGRYLQGQFGERKNKSYETLKAEVIEKKEEEKKEEPEEEKEDEEAKDEAPAPEAPVEEVKKPEKKDAPTGKKEVAMETTPKEDTVKRESTRTRADLQAAVEKKTFLHALGSDSEGDEGIGPNTLTKGLATSKLDDAFDNLDGGVAQAEPGKTATFTGTPAAVKVTGYKGISAAEAGGTRIETKTVASATKEESAGAEIKVRGSVGGSLGDSTGSGRVDRNEVAKVFSRRKSAVQRCYEKALKTNESLKGKVIIQFMIGPAGRVTKIKVKSNSTGNDGVANCIVEKVESWRFPPPEGGSVTFTFPFVLQPG